MKTRWSERWSWQFILAIAAMLGLMLLIGVVTEALAGHAVGSEAQVAWQAQLDRVDAALDRNDQAQALLVWREAYAAALRSRHWQGMVAVGDAYRRLGARGGFAKAAEAKARQAYLVALFRARQESSVDGVLRVADAFAELGDDAVVEQCLAVARAAAAQARDARATDRVRAFAERWDARRLEVEQQTGPLKGGPIR